MMFRTSILVVAVLGAGCVNDASDASPVGSVQQEAGGGGCAEYLCGTNSPVIANFGFWELNLPKTVGVPGEPNNVGFQVLGFVQNKTWYLPKVFEGKLTATNEKVTLSGARLIGGYFYLIRDKRYFKLRVADVGSVESWAQPNPGGAPVVMVESYKLDWTEFAGDIGGGRDKQFQQMCSNPPKDNDGDLLNMHGDLVFHTLLFEGDRIIASKKLDTAIDTMWFNLGCAGSALAKMALTGHTEASLNAHTFETKLKDRQAMLKLLSADYCGDGTPFTVAGQPLSWSDDKGTMKLAAVPLELESRWTDEGAACLERPRVDVNPTSLGTDTFGGDIYDQVLNHCPAQMPPACSDTSFSTSGFHLVSATPISP
jgi:hypothetical protein